MNRNFDAGFWARLEAYVRSLVTDFKEVCVCTLPIFRPTQYLDGSLHHNYQCDGTADAPVTTPPYMAKLIIVIGLRNKIDEIRMVTAEQRAGRSKVARAPIIEATDDSFWAAGAIVAPNEGIDADVPLSHFYMSMRRLEAVASQSFPEPWLDNRCDLRQFVDLGAFAPITSNVPANRAQVTAAAAAAENSSGPSRRAAAAAAAAAAESSDPVSETNGEETETIETRRAIALVDEVENEGLSEKQRGKKRATD